MNKICIPSFSRSDYSSLAPIMKAAQSDKELNLQVLVGGSHLLDRFGSSVKDFTRDGIEVFKTIPFLRDADDSESDYARAFQTLYHEMVEYLISEKPSALFILGDRWEMLACSMAAFLLRIPIVHHSGGDLTQGSLDNQTRYTLTVQSHFHLVAVEEHRQRLISIGEEPWRVQVVGEPALTILENSKNTYLKTKDIEYLPNYENFALATFHPTTFEGISYEEQINRFIQILEVVNIPIFLTAPNPDPNSNIFYENLVSYVEGKENIHFFKNLGVEVYYSCMREASFMFGNSSSGIWEAPSFKLPVINIGNRQADRLRAENVIDCPLEVGAFQKALERIKSNTFKKQLKDVKNPYVFDDTVARILQSFKQDFVSSRVLKKVLKDPLRD